ncbi:cytochrome d ubiquinol oxidase subunit II [Actinopolymorpha rutila]|uniref:Cytochrome d ubiquinol oxidase subunit II n=1 Tax=Actinopolymorpha rutila TaxID=446787 RepID=A0A852Z7V4_9ACTN|nr:cytochrome d ubiquinol oxidase subunit II [Actinopolymorpha rutila]NYH89347.1 cytochrome d ubiquinol oxidase subunit II [Actinopolymorpha rutila]
MDLPTLWFGLIVFFWTLYFVLEGFDFGVGVLARVLGRDDAERSRLLSTIAPVWDGNEVWLVVAGGAMFAAFPGWYATLTSVYYLPLVAILVALILRGVALEFRGKHDGDRWRRRCDLGVAVGSALPPLAWGVALAGAARGLPLDGRGVLVGGFGALLHPYALLGGCALLALCLLHGAAFLRLRTTGELRARASRALAVASVPAVLLGGGFWLWTALRASPAGGLSGWVDLVGAVAGLGVVAGVLLRHDGWAFAGTTAAVGATVVAVFCSAFPTLMPSTLGRAHDLTVLTEASPAYGLRILTIAGLVILPAVLAYQGWSYWVFRKRVAG